MFAATHLITDPAWPWSLPGVGIGALVGVALALALLTIVTYLGDKKVTPRRIAIVLLLRLLALVVALIVVLRPSLAQDEDDTRLSSKLFILLDVSASMDRNDEFNNLSRYEHAKRLLTSGPCSDLLKRMSMDRKIEVVYVMAAEDVRPLDFPFKPTGKRTDIGGWLHELWQRHGQEPNLRGLVLLTDGADNGTRFAALEKAAQFRGACPIFPFGLGRTDTTTASKDIAIDKVWVEPSPVYANGKMTVKAALATPGFDDAVVNVSLWLEDPDGKTMKQVGLKQVIDLRKAPDKIIAFSADAPDRDGELKVTVKVDPLPGDNPANNEASTYVYVSKEGVSILWVDKRRLEPVEALRAIAKDQRLRAEHIFRQPGVAPNADADEWLAFKKHYDVIVIGDVSAQGFSRGKPEVFDKIVQMVQTKGTGLLMLGGYDTFFAGGWQDTKLAPLLPARFDKAEQIETKVRVTPTAAGEQFLLKLALEPAKQKELWTAILEPLDGLAWPGRLDPAATVYAQGNTETGTQKDLPVLASIERGQGRVMIFAGDTTHLAWRRSREAIAAYEQFWTKLMLWLAKRENMKGNLAVRPDTRRLLLAQNERLGFTVNFTKGSGPVEKPKFTGKIVGPRGEEFPVTILEENNTFRGYWTGPPAAGEYRVAVEGEGVDDQKQPVSGKDVARFMVYEEDRENQRAAADHDLLEKIANVSGGQFALAQEPKLAKFLEELPALQDAGRAASNRWPDWRRNPASDAVRDQAGALWQSSALPCFLAFAALLCLEWFLRRRWGMV
jgi:uncharacterized membrane protein